MKKFALTLLIMILTISSFVLVGCNNSKTKASGDNTVSVLLIENLGRVQESQETPVTLALEEKFGIKFDFVTASTHDEVAVNLGRLASTNKIPDLVLTQTSEINKYSKFFLNYKDYRAEMPNMFEYVDEEEVSKQILLGDGSFVSAPSILEISINVAYMIRTDWLENLGLDIPNTFDEFDHVMRAFANDDPNGDGNATQELGFYPMAPAHWLREYCMNFGVSSDNFIDENGVVQFGPTTEEYKKAIEYMADLYQDNVIDKDFLNGDIETYKEYVAQGRVGFTRAYYNRIEDVFAWSEVNNPDAKWQIILPPLNEETGKRYEQRYTTRVGGMGAAINKRVTGEKKDTLIKLVDYLYSEEGRLLTSFGVEGETYEMVDGKPKFLDCVTNNPNWTDSLTIKTYYGIEPGTHFALVQNKDSFIFRQEAMDGLELYESNKEMYENLRQAPPTTLVLNYEQDEQDAALYRWTYISEKEAATTYEFIRGKKSFSKDWDKFMQELSSYGLEEVMETINKAYRRAMGTK